MAWIIHAPQRHALKVRSHEPTEMGWALSEPSAVRSVLVIGACPLAEDQYTSALFAFIVLLFS